MISGPFQSKKTESKVKQEMEPLARSGSVQERHELRVSLFLALSTFDSL